MRHRGVHAGNSCLVEKAGGEEFTGEDEEVLRPFASQAPRAIANARTCRDERRARAGLEALVETSPVGVAVFDARTGRPVSFNREARRIVESLRTPGRSPEHPLQVMTRPPRPRPSPRWCTLDGCTIAGAPGVPCALATVSRRGCLAIWA